jgi:hypothetical protein
MKIEELWTQYQYYTQDVTENSRKLAFAIAAICWFFKTPEATFFACDSLVARIGSVLFLFRRTPVP